MEQWGEGGEGGDEGGRGRKVAEVTFLLGWKRNNWCLNFLVIEHLASRNLCVPGGGDWGVSPPSKC